MSTKPIVTILYKDKVAHDYIIMVDRLDKGILQIKPFIFKCVLKITANAKGIERELQPLRR